MSKFDRYMLSQLLVLFGFFALVLVIVFWINKAVHLFDRLIGDGQTALVFLEFTALGLPRLITVVLPIAAFSAAVYVTNRLNDESELTVMMATGNSPWRLVRPVLLFGLIAGAMMSVLSNFLVPLAAAQLSEREVEISHNITARLLTESTFLSPATGVTFYTRSIGTDGVLRDVFLADRRDEARRFIYTAEEAYLVRNGENTSLIMVNGLAQLLSGSDLRLSTASFRDFSFDITALMKPDSVTEPSIQYLSSPHLMRNWARIANENGTTTGAVAEELHSRIARAVFCVVTALIGFATILVGGHSRFGVWRDIFIAFVLLLALDGMRSSISAPVLEDARAWPILYIPSILGGLTVLALLWTAANPGALRRRLRGGAA
ncbi:LPS export ABC transporter permease LptF [Tateyamaria pelophila]|uniref:LPS export ABC transporter permease LptF n=1 Tax=Tateyamaria pelophila TaxID=328415 RepID=UPI001CBF874F|nr:LPS export ABC transporter permease LptF [Tateyamaria pelophila]